MIECRKLEDFEYLQKMVLSYRHNVLTKEEVADSMKYYIFGYEVFRDNVRQGVAFALKIGHIYTLEGYNTGHSFITAVTAGKMVRDRLLKNYTKTIYTAHSVEEKKVTMLAKMLGFKEDQILDGKLVLKIGG